MPTKNQLIRHGREEKRRTDRTRASDQCPQKQGVCLRVSTRTPKKPNSALRKIAKVRLSNRHDIFAHIPGEGHNSQEHSIVLVRGGRVKDSPGVKSHRIRGVKDLLGIPDRRKGRSKYGAERPKSKWMEDASGTFWFFFGGDMEAASSLSLITLPFLSAILRKFHWEESAKKRNLLRVTGPPRQRGFSAEQEATKSIVLL